MLTLADALASGRVEPRPAPGQLADVVPGADAEAVRDDLVALASSGVAVAVVIQILRAFAAERAAAQAVADRYELVWSGDEVTPRASCGSELL